MRNARFWVYIHGDWVKVTLRPGQSLQHYYSEPAEEGWQARGNRWLYAVQTQTIYLDWYDAGRDCDGVLEHSGVSKCGIDKLCANHHAYVPDFILGVPLWSEHKPTRVYDQYAQMAGY